MNHIGTGLALLSEYSQCLLHLHMIVDISDKCEDISYCNNILFSISFGKYIALRGTDVKG